MERMTPAGVYDPRVYSHVVKAGNTAYISGQVSRDVSGQVVGVGDAAAQTRQAFENLKLCLASVGAGLDRVAKLTVYVVGRENVAAVREVRSSLLSPPYPAVTLVVVAGLALPEFLVEVEAVAILPEP